MEESTQTDANREAGGNDTQDARPCLTRRGKLLAAAAAVLFALGFAISSDWMIELGLFALLLPGLAILLSRLNLSGTRWSCPQLPIVFRGEPFEVDSLLRNDKTCWPALDLEVQVPALGASGLHLRDDGLRCASTTPHLTPTVIATRGIRRGFSYSLASSFPLGLATFHRRETLTHRLVCAPCPHLPWDIGRLLEADGGETPLQGGMTHDREGQFRFIREYVPGDHPRLIAWALSTRRRQLVVRELENARHRHAIVVFHSYQPDNVILSPHTFEKALETLSGVLEFFWTNQVTFDLVADFNAWNRLPVACTPASRRETLGLIAEARMHPTRDARGVRQRLETLTAAGLPLLVLGNAPIRFWRNLVPTSRTRTLCADYRDAELVHAGGGTVV